MELKWRKIEEKIFIFISMIAVVITSFLLVLIIGRITIEALPSLSLYFLLTPEVDTPGYGQGIANAIVGTIYISLISVLIATPLALATAIYLKKYAHNNFVIQTFKFLIEVLSGTPSIVLGIFGLLFLVFYMRWITGGFSLIAGSIALSILILPVIERSIEDAIDTVPRELEEGSYALGSTKWQTIKAITIPYSTSGIITGVVLGVGRAAEESAVIILTAGYTQFFPAYGIIPNDHMLGGIKISPFQEMVAVLPISVYHAFEFPFLVPISNAFATALVLIILVMIINLISRIILWRWKIG